MRRFVWVEIPRIDPDGVWLKVLKEEGNRLLCERNEIYARDVYIEKSEVIKETHEDIF